jgi:UDP-N-acetylmuramate: L-alanyl-gamma-D-glutamyl-meso-diaminopimelate ligase
VKSIEQKEHPSNPAKSVHLTAVCGTGMGALACMFKEAGFFVSGSDHHIYPPMSTFLEREGIKIMEGFRPENLSHSPDLVVVGNAVSRDNPEVVGMFEMGLPYLSFPQALKQFFIREKKLLVVTGTHGKTTTASLLAWVLESAGLDPGFMIGGILKNFGRNCKTGGGPFFVVEGDEYDTAFFDKGPKFLHYIPSRAVITSVEFDHADIYRDLDHLKGAFSDFVSAVPAASLLAVCNHYPAAIELTQNAACRTTTYGLNRKAEWHIADIAFEPPWARFTVVKNDLRFKEFRTPVIGEHNLLNALSVIILANDIGLSAEQIGKGLETFEGVKRRQEIRGVKRGITVIDDFAHHPTAVKETIRAVRAFYPEKRIAAVFEPRSNSSRRNIFQTEYAHSFDMADLVCVRKPTLLEKIPADERFSSERLAADLRERGTDARCFPDTDTIIDFLNKNLQAEDVVLIMSNGGFDNIHERLLKSL